MGNISDITSSSEFNYFIKYVNPKEGKGSVKDANKQICNVLYDIAPLFQSPGIMKIRKTFSLIVKMDAEFKGGNRLLEYAKMISYSVASVVIEELVEFCDHLQDLMKSCLNLIGHVTNLELEASLKETFNLIINLFAVSCDVISVSFAYPFSSPSTYLLKNGFIATEMQLSKLVIKMSPYLNKMCEGKTELGILKKFLKALNDLMPKAWALYSEGNHIECVGKVLKGAYSINETSKKANEYANNLAAPAA